MIAWKDVGDSVQSFVTAGGILAGGIFTYFKFVKDRIYRPRVDLRVEADQIELGSTGTFLVCRASVENKGATKLSLQHDGTAILVRTPRHRANVLRETAWSNTPESGVADIFAKHDWIESTETIRDEALVRVTPDSDCVYRIELRVVVAAPSPTRRDNIAMSTAIVFRPKQLSQYDDALNNPPHQGEQDGKSQEGGAISSTSSAG